MEGIGQQTAIDVGAIVCEGYRIYFNQAKSPSNTLWLNQGVSKRKQTVHVLIVVIIILICAFIVFLLFSAEVSAKIYINYRAEPPNVECSALQSAYTEDQMLSMAALEYFYL